MIPASLEATLQEAVVLTAVPGDAVVRLAAEHKPSRFDGVLLCTAVDLDARVLAHLFPSALVIRVAPFLLPGHSDIPSLALMPPRPDERFRFARAAVEQLGPTDFVDGEAAFETLLHFGSPLPIVVDRAVEELLDQVVAVRRLSSSVRPALERICWRGLQAIAAAHGGGSTAPAASAVATPGGVTERGLREASALAELLASIVSAMIDHARARQRDVMMPDASGASTDVLR